MEAYTDHEPRGQTAIGPREGTHACDSLHQLQTEASEQAAQVLNAAQWTDPEAYVASKPAARARMELGERSGGREPLTGSSARRSDTEGDQVVIRASVWVVEVGMGSDGIMRTRLVSACR